MGDHRASIKIEFEFHGVKDKCDMWINYSSGECHGVDNRVIDFFRKVYEEGMDKYRDALEKKYEDNVEIQERKELKRLQDKYNNYAE